MSVYKYQDEVLTREGNVVAGATITVYLAGTSTLATLYGNTSGTVSLANPVTADYLGFFYFYAAPGFYDLSITGTGITSRQITDIWLGVPGTVRYADQFTGADAGIKIIAALANLPSTGGIVDARAFEGAQTISNLITISKPATILFGYATYTCSTAQSFQISSNGVVLSGSGNAQGFATDGSNNRGTIFNVSSAGASFAVIGSDNGHAYDAGDYDGFQGTRFENFQITNSGAATPLSNGQGNYGNGSYAIRDWRGGGILLDNVAITHFNYGFWGIQSDINHFSDLFMGYNRVAIYLGPRSDQGQIDNYYGFFNDTALQLDGVRGAMINSPKFVSDGSASTYPVVIGGSLTLPSRGIVFNEPWFEKFVGSTDIEAFVGVGVGDAVQSVDISILKPTISNASVTPKSSYLVTVDNGDYVDVDSPRLIFTGNLTSFYNFKGTTSPGNLKLTDFSTATGIAGATNSGSGSPQMTRWKQGGTGTTISSILQNDQRFVVDSGSSAAAISTLRYADRGTVKWEARKIALNDYEVFDSSGNLTRLYIQAGTNALTKINAIGTGAVRFNPDAGSGSGGVLFFSGGGSPAQVASVNSAGLGTFNGGVQVAAAISPTVAGAQTAGTNPLPFSSVFVGAAATNNAQITGTFTAARVHTLPDITGKVNVYLTGTDAAVDLASVANGACTAERTVTITGAAFGDAVDVLAGTALEAGTFLIGKVTAADTVKWQFANLSGGAVDRASDTYTIKVRK